MVIKFILATFLICTSWFCFCQTAIKTYVATHVQQISSIDPANRDYSDLQIIGDAIGEARIVMLGEQDHGDAPTFLAKTRLIKYLHEVKGFNILAFESDFFGLNDGWQQLSKEKERQDAFIRQNIFQIWTHCNECKDLFYRYIPGTYNTPKPISITGFDNQLMLEYSRKYLRSKLDSVFKYLKLPIVESKEYETKILPAIDSLQYGYSLSSFGETYYTILDKYLREIKSQASKKLRDDDFWMQVIDNLIQESLTYQLRDEDPLSSLAARDYQMAKNLRWIFDVKYPKEKIIVWAANAHIMNYRDSVNTDGASKRPKTLLAPIGSYFKKDSSLNKQTYILGFTSFSGKAGRLTGTGATFDIPQPNQNYFETWVDENFKYAFINFIPYRNKKLDSETFLLKGLGHFDYFKADWTEIFDGVFYIRDMYPCNQ